MCNNHTSSKLWYGTRVFFIVAHETVHHKQILSNNRGNGLDDKDTN